MSFFEFVLVIASVIYALGVAQLLAGASRVAQSDLEQRFYYPHAAWMMILFIAPLLTWWSLWSFRDIAWTFAAYLLIILQPVIIYFACSLIAPISFAKSVTTLEAHFSRIRRPLYVAQIINLTISSTDGVFLIGEPFWHAGRIFHFLIVASLALGFVIDGKWMRIAVATIVILSLLLLIVARFWTPAG